MVRERKRLLEVCSSLSFIDNPSNIHFILQQAVLSWLLPTWLLWLFPTSHPRLGSGQPHTFLPRFWQRSLLCFM